MRRTAALLALLAPALAGCLQVEEIFTLFPDGSGKVQVQMAFRKTMIKMLEETGKAQGLAPDGLRAELMQPEKFFENSSGFSAVKPGTAREDGEWIRNSVTAYFDDINKVRMGGQKAGAAPRTATYAPGSLTISNPLHEFNQGFQQGAAQRGATPEQLKASLEFLKPMMEGLRVRMVVVVPGSIREASGFLASDGSTASSEITGESLLAVGAEADDPASRRLKEAMAQPMAKISWDAAGFDPARLASWKTELAEAKAAGPRTAPAAAPAAKPASLGADADQFTDDEVDRLFIEAQLKIARGQIERGQKDQARATLEGVLKDFPKAKAAQEAKKLLHGLK